MTPEIQMEKATSKFIKNTKKMNQKKTSHEEECLALMDKLTVTVKEKEVDINNQMENMNLKTRDEEKDDMSYWEELEILSEGDLSSPEKRRL